MYCHRSGKDFNMPVAGVANGRKHIEKVAVFCEILVERPLQKWSRQELCFSLSKEFGPLTAKNALMYLLALYPGRKPRPLGENNGAAWGPGATAGVNLLAGRVVSAYNHANLVGERMQDILESHARCESYRGVLSGLSFAAPLLSKRDRERLEKSRDEMAAADDVLTQHLLCEVGKQGKALQFRRGGGANYRRNTPVQYRRDPLCDSADMAGLADA